MPDAREQYVLRDKREEVPGVTTLIFTRPDGSVPAFVAGQYINVFFPEFNTPEGKAYSISCAPGGATFSITVRGVGQFSNKLCGLAVGDTISASLPYGFFYPERDDSELVLVAVGIGITPFMSIVQHAAAAAPHRRITLVHGIRSVSDAVFRDALTALQQRMPNLSLAHFVSREQVPESISPAASMLAGQMSAERILSRIGSLKPEMEFLVCGPITFTRDMWKDLRMHGVPEDAIYTEAFFSH